MPIKGGWGTILGETGLLDSYDYNGAGNLCQVRDHAGNVTTIDYNTLGRKINMTENVGTSLPIRKHVKGVPLLPRDRDRNRLR